MVDLEVAMRVRDGLGGGDGGESRVGRLVM